ncbi:MAG: DinB family protein [Gemmatimonadaceae bacterium]
MSDQATQSSAVITSDQLRTHWQAHRRLSRRTIAAFPADKLFTHTVGGMRTFGELSNEMLGMAAPTLRGIITDKWEQYAETKATTQEEVLAQWDDTTAEIDKLFGQIPAETFQEVKTAFGQWKMPVYDLMLYVIDNEVHHRGQGYVYLRALGIEPPPFYDRS